ncbi:MAG: hypothetical protein ACFB10_16530 [Salibacteraceae bacterium]
MAEDLAVGTRVEHPKYGEGIISRVHLTSYDIIFIHGGEIQFSKSTLDLEVLERPEGASASGNSIDIEQVREIIDYALEKHAMNSEIVDLGEKWIGGSLDIKPSTPDLQA